MFLHKYQITSDEQLASGINIDSADDVEKLLHLVALRDAPQLPEVICILLNFFQHGDVLSNKDLMTLIDWLEFGGEQLASTSTSRSNTTPQSHGGIMPPQLSLLKEWKESLNEIREWIKERNSDCILQRWLVSMKGLNNAYAHGVTKGPLSDVISGLKQNKIQLFPFFGAVAGYNEMSFFVSATCGQGCQTQTATSGTSPAHAVGYPVPYNTSIPNDYHFYYSDVWTNFKEAILQSTPDVKDMFVFGGSVSKASSVISKALKLFVVLFDVQEPTLGVERMKAEAVSPEEGVPKWKVGQGRRGVENMIEKLSAITEEPSKQGRERIPPDASEISQVYRVNNSMAQGLVSAFRKFLVEDWGSLPMHSRSFITNGANFITSLIIFLVQIVRTRAEFKATGSIIEPHGQKRSVYKGFVSLNREDIPKLLRNSLPIELCSAAECTLEVLEALFPSGPPQHLKILVQIALDIVYQIVTNDDAYNLEDLERIASFIKNSVNLSDNPDQLDNNWYRTGVSIVENSARFRIFATLKSDMYALCEEWLAWMNAIENDEWLSQWRENWRIIWRPWSESSASINRTNQAMMGQIATANPLLSWVTHLLSLKLKDTFSMDQSVAYCLVNDVLGSVKYKFSSREFISRFAMPRLEGKSKDVHLWLDEWKWPSEGHYIDWSACTIDVHASQDWSSYSMKMGVGLQTAGGADLYKAFTPVDKRRFKEAEKNIKKKLKRKKAFQKRLYEQYQAAGAGAGPSAPWESERQKVNDSRDRWIRRLEEWYDRKRMQKDVSKAMSRLSGPKTEQDESSPQVTRQTYFIMIKGLNISVPSFRFHYRVKSRWLGIGRKHTMAEVGNANAKLKNIKLWLELSLPAVGSLPLLLQQQRATRHPIPERLAQVYGVKVNIKSLKLNVTTKEHSSMLYGLPTSLLRKSVRVRAEKFLEDLLIGYTDESDRLLRNVLQVFAAPG